MDKLNELLEVILTAFDSEVIQKLVLSRPRASEIKKISARLVAHRGRRMLAFELSMPGDTVSHKNIMREGIAEYITELLGEYKQLNLITTLGECEWKVSKSGKTALIGSEKLMRKLSGESPSFVSAVESLDAKKNYILTGGEEFLIKLGISDRSGRVHDKKQGKFRQINRFLEHIEDIYNELGAGDLTIYDLCCGKSYLSFAVYYYLTERKGRRVKMLGIDLKRDVIDWCQRLAVELGFVGMRFVYDDVNNTPSDVRPDMVISLHACDVATDIVIGKAISLGARVILSTPCCHRYLRGRIGAEELGFITRFPHLSNKLSEVITDGLRLMRLEAAGYRVSALELTDPDDTPKNTLIRAIHKGKPDRDAEEKYKAALGYLLTDGETEYPKGL